MTIERRPRRGVAYAEHAQALHRARLERAAVDVELDRQLSLYWLRTVPAYRELIRRRVSEAAIVAERRSRVVDRRHADVDYLGREVEGCG